MEHLKYILLLLIPLLFGCEKVIDVDLNDASPAIVIEGNVGDLPHLAEVKVSKTSSYFDDESGEKISGASVVVESASGRNYQLFETEPGVYRSGRVPMLPGVSYSLKVEVENNIYEAVSTINPRVKIDSLSYFYEEGFAFIDDGYILQVYFVDPENVDNYYRLKVYNNGDPDEVTSDFIIFSDRYFDGQLVEITLRNMKFKPDDLITAQLFAIDKDVFEYYSTLEELMNNNPGSAAPANPNTNLSNDALGYFAAWMSDIKSIVIKVE